MFNRNKSKVSEVDNRTTKPFHRKIELIPIHKLTRSKVNEVYSQVNEHDQNTSNNDLIVLAVQQHINTVRYR